MCHNRKHEQKKKKTMNLAVLSNDVLSNWLPSREKTILVTHPECACSRRRKHWPVLIRQTYTQRKPNKLNGVKKFIKFLDLNKYMGKFININQAGPYLQSEWLTAHFISFLLLNDKLASSV